MHIVNHRATIKKKKTPQGRGANSAVLKVKWNIKHQKYAGNKEKGQKGQMGHMENNLIGRVT